MNKPDTIPVPIRVKAGREHSLETRHPWVFSGALQSPPGGLAPGRTVTLVAQDGRTLGIGAWSPASQIAVRIWSFDPAERIDETFFHRRVLSAVDRRSRFPGCRGATGLRLVNAESDGLPGVIVDRYADFLVCQFLSAGAEFWRGAITAALNDVCRPAGIWERSDVDVRGKEGLAQRSGVIQGTEPPGLVEFEIGDMRFFADLRDGHKTGFYLDQRVNLEIVRNLSAGRDVLNCFAYTGSFGVAALKGGAGSVINLDSSGPALEIAARHIELNGLPAAAAQHVTGDVFEELRRFRDARRDFDLIVLDPPKFVANAAQLQRGSRAYKDINLLAFKLLRKGGLLASFSCSGHVSMELFQKIVADAALDARRDARIIQYFGQAPDHPVLTSYPQGRYLKG
ncbi:MAG TPA: class I SAM-dependent methyltransferase, partial [Gammaproteobacteria bacterium]